MVANKICMREAVEYLASKSEVWRVVSLLVLHIIKVCVILEIEGQPEKPKGRLFGSVHEFLPKPKFVQFEIPDTILYVTLVEIFKA